MNSRVVLMLFIERRLFLLEYEFVLLVTKVNLHGTLYSKMAVRHDPESICGRVDMYRSNMMNEPIPFLQATN